MNIMVFGTDRSVHKATTYFYSERNRKTVAEFDNFINHSDAGLLLDLPVGAYTVILSSVGTKGLGLVGIDAID